MGAILKKAAAGTVESSDVYVTLEPSDGGNVIEIDSVVQKQFGGLIRKAVSEVLAEQEITNARVSVVDRGALDCVIRARVEAAIQRAKGESV